MYNPPPIPQIPNKQTAAIPSMRDIGSHIGPKGLLSLHGAISDLRQILLDLHIREVIPCLIQKLLVPALVGIDVLESVNGERDEGVPAGRLVVPESAEVDELNEDGKDGGASANDDLIGLILGGNEGSEEVYTEDIGINLQELELDVVINSLHAVVVVDVHLVLHVEVDQHHEDQKQHQRDLKGEEGDQRPDLEEDDQLELYGEPRELHLLMQDLLTSHRPVLVLGLALGPVPAAVHEVETSEGDLDDDEVDGLVADESQDGPAEVVMQDQVEIGDEQIEDDVEEDCRDHNEHGPIGEGIGVSHLGELVHDCAEGESDEDEEEEDDVGEDALEGLHYLPHVDHLHEEEEEGHQSSQDQQEVDHRQHLHPQSLLLHYPDVLPQDLLRTRTRLAVHPELLLVIVAQEHLYHLQPRDFVSGENVLLHLEIVEDYDGAVPLVIEGFLVLGAELIDTVELLSHLGEFLGVFLDLASVVELQFALVGGVEGFDLLDDEGLLDFHFAEDGLKVFKEVINAIIFKILEEQAEVGDIRLVGVAHLEPLHHIQRQHVHHQQQQEQHCPQGLKP